jgi:hypothetical protein
MDPDGVPGIAEGRSRQYCEPGCPSIEGSEKTEQVVSDHLAAVFRRSLLNPMREVAGEAPSVLYRRIQ